MRSGRWAAAAAATIAAAVLGAAPAHAEPAQPAYAAQAAFVAQPAYAAQPGYVPEPAYVPDPSYAEEPGHAAPAAPPADGTDSAHGAEPTTSARTAAGQPPTGEHPARPAPGDDATPIGYDVSWPQCGVSLPVSPSFAIVGVTGGLANNTNPCFAEQLAWAQTSVGGTDQPRVALYVNTANPGLLGSWWPTSDTYRGVTLANPYGPCVGGVDAACAYVYGWAKAFDDVTDRGVQDPGNYLWWLDVETDNTWQDDQLTNRAVLEGMTDSLQRVGARVGLYSIEAQWARIVGTVPPESSLYDLPSWLAGARTIWGAQLNCNLPPLTAGGRVALTQYVEDDLDHNYSCM